MIVRPVVLQGTVQNSQNMTSVKHNEDAKPMVEQANITATNTKEVQQKTEVVTKREDINQGHEKHDAKEKGKNEYFSVKVKKNNNGTQADGQERVLVKSSSGFDVKI